MAQKRPKLCGKLQRTGGFVVADAVPSAHCVRGCHAGGASETAHGSEGQSPMSMMEDHRLQRV